MPVKGTLRLLGLSVIAFLGLFAAAVLLEPLDWALRALWQKPTESQRLALVVVVIVAGTIVGIWQGKSSTAKYRFKNQRVDDCSDRGCDDAH